MMARVSPILARLLGDRAGSVVIETAIVAPVLILLGLGTYDTSRIIARQSELQAGSTDVQGIVLAVANGSTGTNVSTIKAVLKNSLALNDQQVSVVKMYRCNADSTLIADQTNCASNDVISIYVQVTLTDTYTPTWTRYGIGSPFNYQLVRTVQVSAL